MSMSERKRTLVNAQQSFVALPELHIHWRLLVRKGLKRGEGILKYEYSDAGLNKYAMRVSYPDMWNKSKLPDSGKKPGEFICDECSAMTVLISYSRLLNTTKSSAWPM